jgi:hypothetical protein
VSLLVPEEALGLRRRLERGARRHTLAAGKVILAGGGPLARRSALVRFGALPGYVSHGEGGPVAFGTLGRLSVGEGMCVDLVGLPSDPALAPLWRPFSSGAMGALVLLPADGIAARLVALARELRLPVGVCGPSEESLEPELRRSPAGFAFLGGDPAEALRRLLVLAARAP